MSTVNTDLGRVLADLYDAETAAVRDRPEADLARPTRTDWTVRELLFHQLLDAQRTLVALASPTDEAADVDAVTYWHPFQPDAAGSADHAEFVRVAASAYSTGPALVEHFASVTAAAARAVRAAEPAARVQTQGHVITVADLLSSLVVEATVHLLDLTVDLPEPPEPPRPSAAALVETRRVLEALAGGPLPGRWSDAEAVLKGTGRASLDPADLADLGPRAARLPLLG
jgi:mycothiol maleylpyruvate isomerase-like protein